MLIASIFEKWKGGCAFGYGFHTHCRPLKMGIVFFSVACFGLADGFLRRKTIQLLFLVGKLLYGLVLGLVWLFSIKNEEKKDIVDGKELFLRCPSQREGVSGRGWAGFRSAPCVFFVFGCIKNRKRRFWFPGPGLIFWKRFFEKTLKTMFLRQ